MFVVFQAYPMILEFSLDYNVYIDTFVFGFRFVFILFVPWKYISTSICWLSNSCCKAMMNKFIVKISLE